MSDTLTLRVLRYLPRNLLSRTFGRVAAMRRPRWLVRRGIRWFARHFDIDVELASQPLESYPSLLAFFTRELQAGARPIVADPGAYASPVDGAVGCSGRIVAGRLLQAKGLDYSLEALLGSAAAAADFQDGHFATLYLSPRDYHRIHVPESGDLVHTLYEPGTLWPVNPPAVRSVPGLFAVNERITSVIETSHGQIAVVMVGATNVGSMRLAYDEFVTNRGGERFARHHDPSLEVRRGDHLATFEMGSTVVLLVANPDFEWVGLDADRWVAMGSCIGRFN